MTERLIRIAPLTGIDQRLFATPTSAYYIKNMHTTPDMILKSDRLSAPLIADYGQGFPTLGTPRGIGCLMKDGWTYIILAVGGSLKMFAGWNKGYITLLTGWNNNDEVRQLVQFETFRGRIYITNGIDYPVVFDGKKISPFGYSIRPSIPGTMGPQETTKSAYFPDIGEISVPSNFSGFTQTGDIGDVDVVNNLLKKGAWKYRIQYMNERGNLSPLSIPSATITLCEETNATTQDEYENDIIIVNIKRLQKTFALTDISKGPTGTIARIIYRTKNILTNGEKYYYLYTLTNNIQDKFCDGIADGELIKEAEEPIPLTPFKYIKSFKNCMFIGNFVGAPRLIRFSKPLYVETFLEDDWIDISTDIDDEIMGFYQYYDRLFVFGRYSIFLITGEYPDFIIQPITKQIGCASINTVQTLPDGTMIWLGVDNIYSIKGLTSINQIAIVPIDSPIREIFEKRNKGFLIRSIAFYDPETYEYILAFPGGTATINNTILAYSTITNSWSVKDGWYPRCAITIMDRDPYTLWVGSDSDTSNKLFIKNRESIDYTGYTNEHTYQSAWLDGGTSDNPKTFKTVYLYLCSTTKDVNITVNFYKDREPATVIHSETLQLVYPVESEAQEYWDEAIWNESKWDKRKPFWIKINCNVLGYLMSFRVVSDSDIEIIGFEYECIVHGQQRIQRT